MSTHADKSTENKNTSVTNQVFQQRKGEAVHQFIDNRPEKIMQMKFQDIVNNSPQVKQLKAYQEMADHSRHQPIQRKENNTGLPNNLKTGVENLSGFSMDDVKVHYNSAQPAQLQAHAYAQGSEIHIGPGQEKHLPHEAWHVVQQKQGRVQPTLQMKTGVAVNDNTGLENEADLMGQNAMQFSGHNTGQVVQQKSVTTSVIQRVIRFKEEDWGEGREAEFIEEYGQEAADRIRNAIVNDLAHAPQTLNAALADPRIINIALHVDEDEEDERFKISYSATAQALVQDVEGGRTRTATSIPELIETPQNGFEQMRIDGLISCFAIYIWRLNQNGKAEAVAGAHFVTEDNMYNGQLNDYGIDLIGALVNMVSGDGTLGGAVCHSDDAASYAALDGVFNYLYDLNVADPGAYEKGSDISLFLHHNGDIYLKDEKLV